MTKKNARFQFASKATDEQKSKIRSAISNITFDLPKDTVKIVRDSIYTVAFADGQKLPEISQALQANGMQLYKYPGTHLEYIVEM